MHLLLRNLISYSIAITILLLGFSTTIPSVLADISGLSSEAGGSNPLAAPTAADHFEQKLLDLEAIIIEFDKVLRNFAKSEGFEALRNLYAFISRADSLQSSWAFDLRIELNRTEGKPFDAVLALGDLPRVKALMEMTAALEKISGLNGNLKNSEISLHGPTLQFAGYQGAELQNFVDLLKNPRILAAIKDKKIAGKHQVESFKSAIRYFTKLIALADLYNQKLLSLEESIKSNAKQSSNYRFHSGWYGRRIGVVESGLLKIANSRSQSQFLSESGRRALSNLQGLDRAGFLESLSPKMLEVLTNGLAATKDLFWMTSEEMLRFHFEIYLPVFDLLEKYRQGQIVPRIPNPDSEPKKETRNRFLDWDQTRAIYNRWFQGRNAYDADAPRYQELSRRYPALSQDEHNERRRLGDERTRFLNLLEAELLKGLHVNLVDGNSRPAKRLSDLEYSVFYADLISVQVPKYFENETGLALEKIEQTAKSSENYSRVWTSLKVNPIEMAMLIVGNKNGKSLTLEEKMVADQIVNLLSVAAELPPDHLETSAQSVDDYFSIVETAEKFRQNKPRRIGRYQCERVLATGAR